MYKNRGLKDAALSDDPRIRSLGERFIEQSAVRDINYERALNLASSGAQRAMGLLNMTATVKNLNNEKAIQAAEDLAASALGTAMYLFVQLLGFGLDEVGTLLVVLADDYMSHLHEEAIKEDADPVGYAQDEANEEMMRMNMGFLADFIRRRSKEDDKSVH